MNRKEVFELIEAERLWQNKKWSRPDGEWSAHRLTKLAVLAEEFGEAAMAINEEQWSELRYELVQIAAVCVGWLEADYES